MNLTNENAGQFSPTAVEDLLLNEYNWLADRQNGNAIRSFEASRQPDGSHPWPPPMLVKVVPTAPGAWEIQPYKTYPIGIQIGLPGYPNAYTMLDEAASQYANGDTYTDSRGVFTLTKKKTPVSTEMWWTLAAK